jgi:hypothetical protein
VPVGLAAAAAPGKQVLPVTQGAGLPIVDFDRIEPCLCAGAAQPAVEHRRARAQNAMFRPRYQARGVPGVMLLLLWAEA